MEYATVTNQELIQFGYTAFAEGADIPLWFEVLVRFEALVATQELEEEGE